MPPTRLISAQPAFDRFALVNAIVRSDNCLIRQRGGAGAGEGACFAPVAENRRKIEAERELGDGGR